MLHQWQQGRCRVLKIPVTSGDSPCVNKSNNDWMEMMMQICPAVEGKSRRLRIVLSHRWHGDVQGGPSLCERLLLSCLLVILWRKEWPCQSRCRSWEPTSAPNVTQTQLSSVHAEVDFLFFLFTHLQTVKVRLKCMARGTEGGRMNEANNQQPEGCIRVCVCGNSWENTVLTHSRLLLGADTVLYNVKAVLWCDCRSAAALRCPGTNKNKSFRWRSISID